LSQADRAADGRSRKHLPRQSDLRSTPKNVQQFTLCHFQIIGLRRQEFAFIPIEASNQCRHQQASLETITMLAQTSGSATMARSDAAEQQRLIKLTGSFHPKSSVNLQSAPGPAELAVCTLLQES